MGDTAKPKDLTIAFNVKYLILFLAVATGVAGAIVGIYAFNKFVPQTPLGAQIISDNETLSKDEVKALVQKVKVIAFLPDEIPDVITITDLTRYSANPFFANAQLRDKILIFKKAGKIIVYNQAENRIVNIGPYQVQDATSSARTSIQNSQESTSSGNNNDSGRGLTVIP